MPEEVEDSAVGRALSVVLDRIDVRGEAVVTAHESAGWGAGVLEALVDAGILVPHTNATGVVCTECEEECWVEPWSRRRPDGEEVLVVFCEHRDDIHHIFIDPERLRQWRADLRILGDATRKGIGLRGTGEEIARGRLWLLGEKRLGGRATRVYLGAGFRPSIASELAGLADEHVVGPSAVLLVPASKPDRKIWPHRSVPCLSIKEIVRMGARGLAFDEAAILHALGRKPKKHPPAVFPTPPGTMWEDISITFLDDDKVHVRVRRAEGDYTYAEMGMEDTRRRAPNAAWLLLRALSGAFGDMGWGHPEAKDSNRAHMKRLRNHLREFFGLEGDPFKPYRRGVGWQSKFSLRQPPDM